LKADRCNATRNVEETDQAQQPQALGDASLAGMLPRIQRAILRDVPAYAPEDMVRQLYEEITGREVGGRDYDRFLILATPLVRSSLLSELPYDTLIPGCNVRAGEMALLLCNLDLMNPLSARAMDLRYFASLTHAQIACALQLPEQEVMHRLQDVKTLLTLQRDGLESVRSFRFSRDLHKGYSTSPGWKSFRSDVAS
jgi:hypothetical protein